MKNIIIVLMVLFAGASSYWIGHTTRPKQVELRIWGNEAMNQEAIYVSDRLYADMLKCSQNKGLISINHSSFESELICYNGQEYEHRDGEWKMTKYMSL